MNPTPMARSYASSPALSYTPLGDDDAHGNRPEEQVIDDDPHSQPSPTHMGNVIFDKEQSEEGLPCKIQRIFYINVRVCLNDDLLLVCSLLF
jgi:hypothetical protein